MGMIPVGNLGTAVAAPAPALQAPQTSQIGQAVARAGETALAEQAATAERRQRAAAALTLAKTENGLHDLHDQLGRDVLEGRVDTRKAGEDFKTRSSKLVEESMKGWAPDQQATMQAHYAGVVGRLERSVGSLVEKRQQQETAGFLDQYGETQSRVAMREGPAKAIERYTSMIQFTGQAAGLNPEQQAQKIQQFKEKVTFDFFGAAGNAAFTRSDIGALKDLRSKVDGPEGEAMDPARRTSLSHQLYGYEQQIRTAQQHAIDKREAQAERALAKAQSQIEAGVPLSADAWVNLRTMVQGTPSSVGFTELVQAERDTQRMLRLPIDQQERYVQQRETDLMQNGGTMADAANLKRVRAAVETNKKALESEPLVAAQRLFGKEPTQVPFAALLEPGGPTAVSAIFEDRSNTLGAMRKQFGNRVGLKPLLPQESAELLRTLDVAGPNGSAKIFGALRAAIDNDEIYLAAMRQIAPDSPVKAHAGMLMAMGASVTTAHNLVAADVVTNTRQIAETMLAGELIVNRSRGDKSNDGSGKSLFIPGRQEFSDAFVSAAGDLYRGRPTAQEADLQAAFSYYVGKAAQTGRLSRDSKDVDGALLKEAISATLGNLVDVNGNGKVKAPIGMPTDEFDVRVRKAFNEAVRTQGLPATVAQRFGDYGLLNYRRDGQYMLTLGGLPVISPKDGEPVVIDLTPPTAGSRYRRAEIPK